VKRILGGVLACAALLLAAQAASTLTSDPVAAVQEEARVLGFPAEDLETLGGSYSTGLLSAQADGRFRSRARPELGEIHIALVRTLPFATWQLARYSCNGQER
jgi:hypothetical protein